MNLSVPDLSLYLITIKRRISVETSESSGPVGIGFHARLVEMWHEHTREEEFPGMADKYVEISRLLGRYAEINHHTVSIYNTKSQEVYYMSDNYLKMTGYSCSEKDYKRWATLYWMRDLPVAQSLFFLQMSWFYRTVVKSKLSERQGSFTFYLHNLMLHPPGSYRHHFSITGDSLEITRDGSVLVMLTIKKDVAGLIKPDSCWWAEYHINGQYTYHFHENERKFQRGSILSMREREILLMIRQGMSTKQISEKLFISPHTVDKHRKNMLEKTGVRDLSALIQVCETAEIIFINQ